MKRYRVWTEWFSEAVFEAERMAVHENGMILLSAGEHLRIVAAFPAGSTVWEEGARTQDAIPEGMP